MSNTRLTLQALLLTFTAISVSGVQKLTVTPDRGTTLYISRRGSTSCKVCTGAGRSRQCNPSLQLDKNTPVLVEFDCSKPQNEYSVLIVQNIECTTKSCNGNIVQPDSSSLPLLSFNRTITWNLKASAPKAFKIDFSSTGLKQISPSERCPDGNSYTLQADRTKDWVVLGRYCRGGPVASAQILNQGSFSLEVPAGQKLQKGTFDVSVGEGIQSFAKMTLTLPKGTSTSELFSPNYPDSFPDNDAMEWYFQVPDKHKAAVQILNLSQPSCLKKVTAVEYKGRQSSVLRLADRQPEQNQGNFALTLRNCEMDRRRFGSPGLSLQLRVSSSPVLCEVDVRKVDGLSLDIEKLKSASKCKMTLKSVPKEKITVTSKSELAFLDCLPEDLQLSAMRVIECRQPKDCLQTPFTLSVPMLPSCLPAPLSSVTWTLRPSQDGTVELTSPTGPLKQSIPLQKCNDSIIIKVAEEDGTVVGHFCRQGAIQNIQIHNKVTVTMSGVGVKAPRMPFKLSAAFKKEIKEDYIFTVSPKRDSPPFYLASPGWSIGMKPSSTVTWMINLPSKMKAQLMFANVTQPKCKSGHTSTKVQIIGRKEEQYSRREDEKPETMITVPYSFYLNMSNCQPESREFNAIIKITLKKNHMLTIILSVVAALLVIAAIVLAVVCVVIRKKKKKMLSPQVSIYNQSGTFLPGQNSFSRTRDEDSESHVYASIEDSLVYSDLLRKGAEMGVYGEFNRESQKLLGSRDSADDMPVSAYQQFQAPPLPVRPPSHEQILVDNGIYHTGDQSEEEHSLNVGPEPKAGN